MQKQRLVIEIFGKGIEKYGFSYDSGKSDDITWYFKREVENIVQMIVVMEHRYQESLIMRLRTDICGSRDIDVSDIIPRNKYSNESYVWPYQNEQEFRMILIQFIEIIKVYGIKKLKEMCRDNESIPTAEMGVIANLN